jgi:hypothetical protein
MRFPEPRAVGILARHYRERLTLVFPKRPDAARLVVDDVPIKPLLLLTPPLRQTLGLPLLKSAVALIKDQLPLLRIAPTLHGPCQCQSLIRIPPPKPGLSQQPIRITGRVPWQIADQAPSNLPIGIQRKSRRALTLYDLKTAITNLDCTQTSMGIPNLCNDYS